MGFLGMGVQEIVIIAIVALIIFGPDRLPELAGQAGKLLRDARRMTTDLQGEFEREAGVNVRELRSQVDREIAGVKGELTGATNTLQKEVNSAKRTAQSAANSANKSGTKSIRYRRQDEHVVVIDNIEVIVRFDRQILRHRLENRQGRGGQTDRIQIRSTGGRVIHGQCR